MNNLNSAPENTPADDSLHQLINRFDTQKNSDAAEIRDLSCNVQAMITQTQAILNQLGPQPWWKRLYFYCTGHTKRLKYVNECNQVKLQQATLFLITALTRQNEMVMDGLQLTLQKLERIEKDAAYLRAAFEEQKKKEKKSLSRRLFSPVKILYIRIKKGVKRMSGKNKNESP